MAQYTTTTSDRKKGKALKWWLIGCVGTFGLENFYVGKIKNGLIHCLFGFLVVMTVYAASKTPGAGFGIAIMWGISALPNFFKILLGTFRDNVGAVLRE